MTCLANDFEPSIVAAAASGPKQARPAPRSASAAPATRGASGPTTTRSGLSLRARARIWSGTGATSGYVGATAAMPGFPGAAWTSSAASARTRACSRPPEPTTSMRTPWRLPEQVPDLEGLVAARADADRADRRADHLLHRADVGPRVGRQLVERAGLGDVLPPAVEVLVDRRRVVEVGLRHRDLVVPLPVHLVGHADRHPVQA